MAAVDRFMDTWNSRDARAWTASLHFPHARPSPGGGRVWQNAAEHSSGVDFSQVLRTGWHHSRWDSRHVIHASATKAHVAGQYTRYDGRGEKLLSNLVTYVATAVDGEWGIRARFSAGRAGASAAEKTRNEAAALDVVTEFLKAFNARDSKAWAATLNYPHLRVAGGALRVWDSAPEYVAEWDFDSFAQRTGWHHSMWDSMEAVQVATDGVNIALDFSRYDSEDRKIATYRTLYLVTRQEGHWGVQARSSFAP